MLIDRTATGIKLKAAILEAHINLSTKLDIEVLDSFETLEFAFLQLEELVELEKRMKTLESESPSVDYSMIQTYREMIHSRKAFFNELNL